MSRKQSFDGDPKGAPPAPAKSRPRQTLEEWAVDLCWVKECRDGFVSIEINGYSVLFGCPQCDRAYTDRPGYTSIPSIKRWKGRLELYTHEEMALRQEDRKFVIARLREGRRPPRIPEASWTPAGIDPPGGAPVDSLPAGALPAGAQP